MLAQFALIVFGMFAVLTLVIDLGFVTLTRVQMQNAADSASVEGLRLRNRFGDGYKSDCIRRIAARDLVRWTFDDDLDAANGDERQFGAGPVIDLSPGLTELDAARTMSLPDDRGAPHVYKPDLQYNLQDNALYGDMVSGHYDVTQTHDEGSDYVRGDFTAAPGWGGMVEPCPADMPAPGSEPTSGEPGLLSLDNDSFLVRLRRTSDRAELDDIAGVTSRGPTIPLLFGRGALIGAEEGSAFSVRRDGLTVRGMAIAQPRPALRIGGTCLTPDEVPCSTPNPALRVPERSEYYGAVSFALDSSCLDALTGASVDANGTITSTGCAVAGHFVSPAAAWRVGNALGPTEYRVPTAGPVLECGFVPVYQTLEGQNRVIGFIRGSMTGAAGDCTVAGAIPGTVFIDRSAVSRVAAMNASAHDVDPFSADLSSQAVTQILALNAALSGGLLAPVLVR